MEKELEWTGERMVNETFLAKGIVEHLHRYAISLEFVEGKTVLDIACGEGYGSNLLCSKAKKVFGVDISKATIEHAKIKYQQENLEYIEGSVLSIPLETSSIDVVVSFETLEHLAEQEKMLSEFKRVLKSDGILIISTPEKSNYQEIDPNNQYHLKELNYAEFERLLKQYFDQVKIAHQQFLFSSQIFFMDRPISEWVEYSGSFYNIEKKSFSGGHYFNIGVCTNAQESITIDCSVFNGNAFFRRFEQLWVATYDQLNNKVNAYTTVDYKVGKLLLKPFRFIKKLIEKRK